MYNLCIYLCFTCIFFCSNFNVSFIHYDHVAFKSFLIRQIFFNNTVNVLLHCIEKKISCNVPICQTDETEQQKDEWGENKLIKNKKRKLRETIKEKKTEIKKKSKEKTDNYHKHNNFLLLCVIFHIKLLSESIKKGTVVNQIKIFNNMSLVLIFRIIP